MRDLEDAVADILREDAADYDPAARDRVLASLTRATPQPRSRRRHRVWGSMIAAAALTAAAVLTGTLAQHLTDGPDQRGERPDLLADLHVPPGTRLVGLGRVVVAVPARWVNWQPSCTEAGPGYVYFQPVAAIRCVFVDSPERVVPSLGLESTATPTARELLQAMRPVGDINGMEVSQDDPDCPNGLGGTCTQHFAVPEADVLFTVRFLNTSGVLTTTFTDIRNSLTMLPDGLTTVPHQDDHMVGSTGHMAAELMRSHGLEPRILQEPQTEGDVLVSITPSPGSPIQIGDTVTLTVTSDLTANSDVHSDCMETSGPGVLCTNR